MMFPYSIFTLTTDSDNGLETSVHTTQFNAWLCLIGQLIGVSGDLSEADEAKRIEAMLLLMKCSDVGEDGEYGPLLDWFAEFNAGSLNTFSIQPHDLAAAYQRDIRAVAELIK